MLCVVTKVFRSDRPHQIGDVVDTTGWRLERQLREQGYIRPATEGEIRAATRAPIDRPAAAPATGAQAPRARRAVAPRARKPTKPATQTRRQSARA